MKKVLVIGALAALVGAGLYVGSRWLVPLPQARAGLAMPDTTLTVPAPQPLRVLYGFDVDHKRVVEGEVRPNQFLGDLLSQFQVPYETIRMAVSRAEGVFDVRKFASHRHYAVIMGEEQEGPAEQFVYEPSPFEYVVFNLTDSVYVSRVQRRIDTVQQVATGIIYSSLYETLMEAGAMPQLANALADVFAWQVDFFHLAKEDRFKVIYEQYEIEGKPVGVGKVLGAVFEHNRSPYYAVHFDQGEGDDYFDEEGESLRKQFLRAPLDYTRISSRYSLRRYHPVQRRYKAHLGTDYAAPRGTPIRSVGDGVILEARYSRYNGNYVKVRHNSVYTTQYLHMSKIAGGMKPGTRVRQGQVIGYVGATGLATGNHLCYRFWKNGRQIDALRVELPPSEPIKEDFAPQYFQAKDAMLAQLEQIAYPLAPTEQEEEAVMEATTDVSESTEGESTGETVSVAPDDRP